jgi:hypothetical protein
VDGVLAVNPQIMNDGSLSCDLIVIQTGRYEIVVSVNIDTDEILVELDDGTLKFEHNPFQVGFREKLIDIEPAVQLAGKHLGWAWRLTNQQGYSDGLLFALGTVVPDALEPAIALIGEGSSISVLTMSPLRPDQQARQTLIESRS